MAACTIDELLRQHVTLDPTDSIPRPLADAFAEVNRQIDLILDQAKLAPAA